MNPLLGVGLTPPTAVGTVAPPASLVVLAKAVLADPQVCTGGQTNSSVRPFEEGYNAWVSTWGGGELLVAGVYGTDVQSALNDVLGGSTVPTCMGGASSAPSTGAASGSSTAPSNTASSNTALYVAVGVSALAAVGALVYTMRRSPSAMRNPIEIKPSDWLARIMR